jgi:hypothetical protein
MTKKTTTAELEVEDSTPATTEPTTVIGKKHVRRKYTLGDDYKEWKSHCDDLKAKATFYGSEARRLQTEYKKCYENGAEGFCNARDDRQWDEANNLITIAAMKEDERANAWKTMQVAKLDLPQKLITALCDEEFVSIEQVSDWVERTNRDKIKGIGDKAVALIRDAVNRFVAPYHAPIIREELERAKWILEDLSKK